MFCASTTVIFQSNAIHTGNDKHAPYVIPLYQLVPEPLCIRQITFTCMTLEYAYTNTKRCKLMNLDSIYSVHYVRHFDIFPRGPPDTCISYILIRNLHL